jgi:chaperonin cofactor prefoldin
VAEQGRQIENLKAQAGELRDDIADKDKRLSMLLGAILSRDEIVALQHSVGDLILRVYRPEMLQYIKAETEAARRRVEAIARPDEDPEALASENRA